MATRNESSGFRRGTKERLLNHFDEMGLAELLELDEPWTVRDCGGEQIKTARDLKKLLVLEVIEIVGQKDVRWPGQTQSETINCYAFDRRAREVLEQYRQSRNELPCGHRAHIHHRSDGRFGCRYCDEDRTFDRAVVERAMD